MKNSGAIRITLKTLIEKGVLKPDVILYATLNKQRLLGTLNKDGSIRLKTNNGFADFQSPTGAARTVRKSNVNGWIVWKILDSGVYKDLKSYKDAYILMTRKVAEPQEISKPSYFEGIK